MGIQILSFLTAFVTISAKSYEELLWRKQQMTDMLKSMDMYISDCRFQQEAALQSVMPFLKIVPSLEKKSQRNVLISGAGKTFTLQLLALRMRMRGIQYIKIAPGSPHCINVMEIRHTITPEMELIDEMDYSEMDSMLARKIQQLMIFFSLLIPDMTNEEEQMLDEALIKTYTDFGITHDNDSLYVDATASPPKMKPMPILGALHKNLLDNPMTQRIAVIVSRFVTCSAQSFNQQTNVDLSNKYIVLDLSELKGKLLPVGMMIALDYVWDNVKADRTKKKAIMIDEIWQLVGAYSNKMAAEFCLTIFKTIRGFGGAAISATQDLSDFFGLEDGKYGRAIVNNSKNKIILNLEPDEARYVQEVLKLTKTEMCSITRFERGEALVYSNNNKVPVVIKASKEEQEMITTDRAELEAILRERQQGQTQTSDKILRNLKKQMRVADVAGGYYIGLDSMCQPDQRTILAVWVTLLSFVGEYPAASVHLLGNERVYKALIHKLTMPQLFRDSQTGTEITCRLLNISGKGSDKTIRLYKAALPILEWIHPDSYGYYMNAFWDHRFPGDVAHRECNHRVAEAALPGEGGSAACNTAGGTAKETGTQKKLIQLGPAAD